MRASSAPAFTLWTRHHALWALGTGAFFSILLNLHHLLLFTLGRLTVLHLLNHGRDEVYYVAVIRGLARGAGIYHAATEAPIPQAWLLRAGLSLPTVLLAGDILYPLLATFFLFFTALALLRSPKWSAATALLMAASLGNYWLRTSNPQVPYVVLAAYAAVYCSGDERRGTYIIRGVLIGLLCHVQLLYGSFLFLVEGVDAARRVWMHPKLAQPILRSVAVVLGSAVILCLPIIIGLLVRTDPTGGDMIRRLGMIPSHYPSAPQFQLQLLLVGGIFLLARFRPKSEKTVLDRFLVFIVAALIGFNQALVHGIDATFSSYYVNVFLLLKWLAIPVLAIAFLGRTRAVSMVIGIVAVFLLLHFAGGMGIETAADQLRLNDYLTGNEKPVIEQLPQQHATIAAPLPLANLIPDLTDHDVLFTNYAYNWRITDEELAQRYLLQRALFPTGADLAEKEQAYPSVFGGYAGMLAARERTACRYREAMLMRGDDCSIDPRTLVVHQDLLAMIDKGDADLPALLKKFGVSMIVTDWILPADVQQICTAKGAVGKYTLYGCNQNDQ